MIDKYRLDDLRLESGEKGELARWVIQLQIDLDNERRNAVALEAAEKRIAELAVENADLKHPGTYLPSKIDTPATDAFTNEMLAHGVERCATWIQGGCKYSRMAEMLREFARNMREGKA
ncbi:hypothetical protein [Edwardsiella tarda]|uniref:hypothetical protein n=1 Tax=Edwardsiella tarda TaxID=636 RepID=UPI00351C391D